MSKAPKPISGTNNPVGRPAKLSIADPAILDKLKFCAKVQATIRECADFFMVSPETFEKFINKPAVRKVWEANRSEGKISLRRTQYQLAEKNAQMAIHLGKVYLGQKDEIDVNHRGSIDISGASVALLGKLARALGEDAAGSADEAPAEDRPADE